MQRAIKALKNKLSTTQHRNVLSMIGAEAVAKLSRIVTLLAMAAFLVPAQYGSAMLALACHDMIRLVLRCGAGSQLVQCSDDQLPAFAKNAVVMQVLLSVTLAALQYTLAIFLGEFYNNPELKQLLQQLSAVYLLYPVVSVRVFLLQRSNKLGYFGFCNGLCVSIENLSIALLLWLGQGIEVVVYGKFIYAILWILLFIRVPVAQYGIGFDWQIFKKLLANSSKLLQSELSRALRINADVLIAGKLLSPEIFGIYSFAKSASIAVSQAFSNAVTTALYPQFCVMQRDGVQSDSVKNIVLLMGLVCALYATQALLAPFYIQWVFGNTWLASIPVAVWLCISAIPIFLIDMVCVAQRAAGAFTLESHVRLAHLSVLVASLCWLKPESPLALAQVMLYASSFCLLLSLSCVKPSKLKQAKAPLCDTM
ncbi:oligosaccharide flippase family protein [Planctobacterium marinum]|uniref:Polysaccharide biosynthesis protein n=1 Tax=Planctobacterium marinum TaxID=1631968 RepID=A0AA48HT77_9ALTE|nr:hypothetical protein MACH26_37830 [Planctobacterium marinum]